MKVRWFDRVTYVAARAAIGVAARIPQWLGYAFADLLGRTWFHCDRRRRGYALHFLRNAFPGRPERELLRLGARSTGNLFKVPLDMARLTRLLGRGGDIREVLEPAEAGEYIARLRPPYFGLTAHLGNWEVSAIGVAQLAGGAHGVARIAKNPLLQQWILENRQRGGLLIHPRRGGIRDMAKALAGGSVGLQVVDQNQRLRGAFVPFFGEVASCERAAVSLALRHGYPILIGAAIRQGRGFRFRFLAAEPFVLAATGDRRADLLAGVARVNRVLEDLIRQVPEQYLWIHDRYRTKAPVGAAHVDGDDDGDEP